MSYEDAVKAVQITSIANAVDQMYYIMDGGDHRSAIRGEMLAEVKHIQHIVEKMGGMVWSNPWQRDVASSDGIAVPEEQYWPNVQTGDIITHDGKQWQVVVNFVHVSTSDLCAKAFSVYAIIPA